MIVKHPWKGLKMHDSKTSTVESQERFSFGENWMNFLPQLNDSRILAAELSLKKMFAVENLDGKTFLDIGSGSGLFSLAARNLGANVTSFDFDEKSVWCTEKLKSIYYQDDVRWAILNGSVLDKDFLTSLGEYDYVYSWGVLHHTGDMKQSLENVIPLVKHGGNLFIAIYNHQPFFSRYWTFVKKTYNRLYISRPLWFLIHGLYPTLPSILIKIIQKRQVPRGMTVWYDLNDWLGGYPFEVATPKEIFDFYKGQGFSLIQLKTVGGRMGCNEFVFSRISNEVQR